MSSPWRATNVTAALDWILSTKEHRGRWWVLALAGQDVPPPVQGIRMTVSTPAFGGGNHAQDALALHGGRLGESGTRAGGLDGILMCLLPADHPQAWRCYNQQALRECLRRLQGGGTMMVRVQADLRNLAKALAAARTFHQVVGSGWAIGEVSQDRLDLLLAGPESAVASPTVAQGAFAVPLQQLWDRWPGIRPIRMTSPSDTGAAAEGSDE